jgi:DNA-binding NarL/FixJ family response regulator
MGRRVLIVDDHADFRRRMRQVLEYEGCEVVGEAGDGASGLDARRELQPDLVLLDVHLPDALGFELVREFADPVILISTRDEAAYHARAERCGAKGFITKSEVSAATIERVLG